MHTHLHNHMCSCVTNQHFHVSRASRSHELWIYQASRYQSVVTTSGSLRNDSRLKPSPDESNPKPQSLNPQSTLPVTTAGLNPLCLLNSSNIQAIMRSSLPISGAGTSVQGPMTSFIACACMQRGVGVWGCVGGGGGACEMRAAGASEDSGQRGGYLGGAGEREAGKGKGRKRLRRGWEGGEERRGSGGGVLHDNGISRRVYCCGVGVP